MWRRRTSSSSAWPSATCRGGRRISPSIPTSLTGRFSTASPLTPQPSPASATRCILTCFCSRTRPRCACCPGGPIMAVWPACSAASSGPTAPPSRPTPASCSVRRCVRPRTWALPSPSVRRWSSISSSGTSWANPPSSPMTMPVIWISPPRTRARTSGGRSA